MTFNVNVPLASTSPGLFPAQNIANYGRLQALISGDHQFNNSAAANDGKHKQVTYINRADPTGPLPAGTDFIGYTKDASDGIADTWGYDGSNPAYQMSWRQVTGTFMANLNPVTPALITTIPSNVYGIIYFLLPSGIAITTGSFISTNTNSGAYTNLTSGNTFLTLQRTSGSLQLRAYAQPSYDVLWNYIIQYRKYA